MATKQKTTIRELTVKNEYVLRDGMAYADGDKHIVGPEVLLLTLEKAYQMRHLLEGSGEIKEEYEKVYGAKLRAQRVGRLAQAYRRAGCEEDEALEKAQAVIGREDDRQEEKKKKAAKGGKGGGDSA